MKGSPNVSAREDHTALRLHVELVHDAGCPQVDSAREVLTRALQEAGVPAVWTEWCADDPACPVHLRGLGSPTLLVNGKDVCPGPHPWAPRQGGEAPRCRIYEVGGRMSGTPSPEMVLQAITHALGPDIV